MNKIDWQKEIIEARFKNIQALQKKLLKGKIPSDVRSKVKNYAKRIGYTEELLLDKCITDDLFCINFIKDPTKQNFFEKKAFEYLKQMNGVIDPKNLDNSGDNAYYIYNSNARKYDITLGEPPTKSIDFMWKIAFNNNVISAYATHKYTQEGGGSQDNQFKDVKVFCENVRDNFDPLQLYFAILDGEYYQKPYIVGKAQYKNKIEYLRNIFSNNSNRLYILTTEELCVFHDNIELYV